jgi:hypothetical protein
MMTVHKENIEEYLLLLIDGELSAAEEATVMDFIESHSQYQVLLDQYLQTKLEIETFVFEDKASLLKPETNIVPLKRKRTFLPWAAGIAAIISIGTAWKMMYESKQVVEKPSIALNPIVTPLKDTNNTKNVAAIIPPHKEEKPSVKPYQQKQNNRIVGTIKIPSPNIMLPDVKRNDSLKPLPIATYNPLEIEDKEEVIASNIALPAIDDSPETQHKWSPLNPEKLQLLDALVHQIETLKDSVQTKAKTLRITTVAIRFGDRQFTIGK